MRNGPPPPGPGPGCVIEGTGSTQGPSPMRFPWLFRLGTALALAAALVVATDLLVVPDRGLDLTDEGFHLLALQHESESAMYGLIPPFAWHTKPLFEALGQDLARFRAAGVMVFLGLHAVFGGVAVALGQAYRSRGAVEIARQGRDTSEALLSGWLMCMVGALAASSAAYLFYGGLILRTPSYYWVNLIGAVTAALGLIALAASGLDGRRPSPSAILTLGLGAWFGSLGNPALPFVVLIAVSVVLAPSRNLSRILSAVGLTAAVTGGLVVIAVGVGLWSATLPQMVVAGLRSPSIFGAESNVLLGLLGDALDVPRALLLDPSRRFLLGVVPLAVVLLAGSIRRLTERIRRVSRWTLGAFALTTVVVLGASPRLATAAIIWLSEGGTGPIADALMPNRGTIDPADYIAYFAILYSHFVIALVAAIVTVLAVLDARWAPILVVLYVFLVFRGAGRIFTSAVLFAGPGRLRLASVDVGIALLVVLVGVIVLSRLDTSRRSDRGELTSPAAVVSALVMLAFGTAVGSANGYLVFLQLSAGLFVGAVIMLAVTARDPRLALYGAALVTSVAVVFASVYAIDNRVRVYRSLPVDQQVIATEFGPHRSRLLLDRGLADSLIGITAAAAHAGWTPGTPLLDLVSPWAPGIPAHLGARVPESILLTMGGWSLGGEDALLRHNLERAASEGFPRPWLLITAEHADDRRDGRTESLRFLAVAGEAFGFDFPTDFAFVHRAEFGWVPVELWAPIPSNRDR